MDTLRDVGLDLVAKHLAERGVGELSAEAVCTVLGRAGLAGSSRPLPASAALVRLGEAGPLWLPAPSQPAQPDAGRAPLYLHGGRLLVLPTVRLFLRGADEKPEEVAPEYLSLSDWFADAVAVWRFARREGAPRSLLEHLREEGVSATEALQAIGRALVYALFGSDGPFTVSGLRLPAAPMWLRPVDETPFALEAARALVVTARLDTDPERPAVPTTDLRAAGYRIRPADRRDWGLDPVHTPEGADIRLTGRLGVGVAVRDRRLHAPDCQRPALSVSTARLPFAGHDDPRRLLMAANMQVHAMPLPLSEAPRVRTDDRGTDPPGVNLRVAYLAWQGSNHEDAWVLSESAARRLGTSEEVVTTAAIGAVELAPEMLVQVGQQVERGQLLLRRFVSPILLSAAVGLLASLPDLDEKVQLRPEVDDTVPESGEVVAIEQWDLGTGEGIPQDWEVPESVRGAFRSVLRIHIRRTLPLEVGDKLANRHGHKGVVGAILPDETMPRWRDEPLDALIDPISVLNRSNWGQIYEALAGAVVPAGESRAFASVSAETVMEEVKRLGADGRGRWSILLPASAGRPAREVRAVAGVQFVMRMPHHARDRISGSPVPAGPLGSSVRRRSQRFGEMDHWALWAHGGGAGPAEAAEAKGATLCPAVSRLGRLLAAAGFDLKKEGDTIVLRRLALGEAPPPEWTAFSLTKASEPAGAESKAGGGKGAKTLRSLADLYDALDAITPETPTALVFDPPLTAPVSDRKEGQSPEPGTLTELHWLPLLPACDRPNRRLFDGSEEPHELTVGLRRVVRLLRGRQAADDADLFYAVRRLLGGAYAAAVGRGATGQFSSKRALLRRGVLGRRLPRSARATVSPGGPLGLALDEIGLPAALAHTLFGPRLPASEEELAEAVNGRQVWLKRDPVLHRWGLLPVRVRVVPGHTIRLPTSLLGPLGADFDGDTVALFAALPGAPADLRSCAPPALARHPILQEVMFKPGKQYQYGLHLLGENAALLAALQEDLDAAGAPPWPGGTDVKKALQEWVGEGVDRGPEGRWWSILEEHALNAIADDPGLGFGLGSVDDLASLPVVRCGAAKDLYGDRQTLADILAGKSLDIFHAGDRSAAPARRDPIAEVMVAAKAAIGQFGGALRRLVYSARELRPDDVQQAQCLTEQVTQAALSVKAGKPPLRYADFERQLRRLLRREEPERKELDALLAEIGKKVEPVWEHLCGLMPREAPAWLGWLRKPHELEQLVKAAGEVRLPLNDLRLRCWLEEEG